MKKKFMATACLAFACAFAFGSCGAPANSGAGDSTSEEGNKKGMIQVDALDLGEAFNAEYYPVKNEIKQQQGEIDVVILFEGTEKGWEAAAKEYERLHSNAVVVNLDTNWTSSNYPDKLNQELSSSKSKWDIVQGNLAASSYTQTYCVNMNSRVFEENAYAGNKVWSEVLTEDAYISDKSGDNDSSTYLMNSEGLQTAWFVNKVALEAAAAQGYNNGVAENPTTWAQMISLCDYMVKAGYENPLGISVSPDSVSTSQFTWLLRVYGDYYYRNEYNNIATDEALEDGYTVDLESENPESAKNYKYSETKLVSIILDEEATGYVGGTSAKFQDFISQLGQMRDYLSLDAATKKMDEMRSDFKTQSKGKASPQIMLDYAGFGISFLQSTAADFEMDFFDYPIMESDYVAENTLLRDVGGNGGYLAVVNHDQKQNELTLDFMKFFMSPYGQTVYYNALAAANVAPKGLTTVVNELVLVPDSWTEFFATTKIQFTGLSDSNPFVSYFIRSLNGESGSIAKAEELWMKYLTAPNELKGQSDSPLEEIFGGQWQDALFADWPSFCKTHDWNENCYKYPGKDVTYGG